MIKSCLKTEILRLIYEVKNGHDSRVLSFASSIDIDIRYIIMKDFRTKKRYSLFACQCVQCTWILNWHIINDIDKSEVN